MPPTHAFYDWDLTITTRHTVKETRKENYIQNQIKYYFQAFPLRQGLRETAEMFHSFSVVTFHNNPNFIYEYLKYSNALDPCGELVAVTFPETNADSPKPFNVHYFETRNNKKIFICTVAGENELYLSNYLNLGYNKGPMVQAVMQARILTGEAVDHNSQILLVDDRSDYGTNFPRKFMINHLQINALFIQQDSAEDAVLFGSEQAVKKHRYNKANVTPSSDISCKAVETNNLAAQDLQVTPRRESIISLRNAHFFIDWDLTCITKHSFSETDFAKQLSDNDLRKIANDYATHFIRPGLASLNLQNASLSIVTFHNHPRFIVEVLNASNVFGKIDFVGKNTIQTKEHIKLSVTWLNSDKHGHICIVCLSHQNYEQNLDKAINNNGKIPMIRAIILERMNKERAFQANRIVLLDDSYDNCKYFLHTPHIRIDEASEPIAAHAIQQFIQADENIFSGNIIQFKGECKQNRGANAGGNAFRALKF